MNIYIYIRKYYFNIKGAHHLITKLFFSFNVAFHAHLVHFPPLYNATLLAVFNIQIFTKHNQSSIFIIVFVHNESNNFMYGCEGRSFTYSLSDFDSLQSMSLYLFTRYMRDDKSNVLSIFMLSGSIKCSLPFQFKSNHVIFLNHAFESF